jgi:hypothetical protein
VWENPLDPSRHRGKLLKKKSEKKKNCCIQPVAKPGIAELCRSQLVIGAIPSLATGGDATGGSLSDLWISQYN